LPEGTGYTVTRDRRICSIGRWRYWTIARSSSSIDRITIQSKTFTDT